MDLAKDGWNWYVYCNNNPLVYVDLDGRDPVIAVLFLGLVFAPEVSELVSVYGPTIAQGVNELFLFCGDKISALLDDAKELGRSIVDFFIHEAGSKGGGTGDPDPDKKGTGKTVPEITDSQLGKKLVDHANDYGLTKSKEGVAAYKQITQDVLQNALSIGLKPYYGIAATEIMGLVASPQELQIDYHSLGDFNYFDRSIMLKMKMDDFMNDYVIDNLPDGCGFLYRREGIMELG